MLWACYGKSTLESTCSALILGIKPHGKWLQTQTNKAMLSLRQKSFPGGYVNLLTVSWVGIAPHPVLTLTQYPYPLKHHILGHIFIQPGITRGQKVAGPERLIGNIGPDYLNVQIFDSFSSNFLTWVKMQQILPSLSKDHTNAKSLTFHLNIFLYSFFFIK